MASVWRHPKSRYWSGCYTDSEGKQRKRSTKETDRRKALKIAEEWEKPYRRKVSTRQFQRVINEVHAEIHGSDLPSQKASEFFEGWLTRKKGTVSDDTLAFYRATTNRFSQWLGPRSNDGLGEIGQSDILKFRNMLAEELAPTTVNHRLKTLRMMFQEAKRDGLITDNPAEFVPSLKKTQQKSRRAFTMEELKRVLEVAEDTEWKSLVMFGLYTGQRLGDLVQMTWEQINLDHDEISFITSKTGRRVLVPVSSHLKDHILSLPSSDSPESVVHPQSFEVFVRGKGTRTLSRQFGELLARAGLRMRQPHRRKSDEARSKKTVNSLTFHSLRHTAVSLLKNAGVSSAIVQDIVGHESAEISTHYTHIDQTSKRKAIEFLPPLS